MLHRETRQRPRLRLRRTRARSTAPKKSKLVRVPERAVVAHAYRDVANTSFPFAADATVTEPGKTEQAEAPGADAGAPAETADAKEQDATTAAAEAAPEGDAAAAATAEPNGTPASLKRTSSSKRKSTGGVPEHKNKLNRKKSQVRVTHLHAKPGEYYIARLRSYPPWPSIICDEEMLPQSLLSTRPVTAMRPDGTYRDDYADGGKRAHERTFPIMFLQTNELYG